MKQTTQSSIGGFSLVEVCLAIGIVVVGFVSIIGLLPAGMDAFRSSMNTSVGAQLVQRVLNEAQQSDFYNLVGGNPPQTNYEFIALRTYDEQGNELTDGNAVAGVYQVHAVAQYGPAFPDDTGKNTVIMDELATVTVQIAVNPGGRKINKDVNNMWAPTPGVTIQNYPVLVAHHD
jgi:uncharacterized protein (TIGR02598 family)